MALTPLAWAPAGDLRLDEWADQGRRLGAFGRNAGWWIGDWLQYGNARFGERYVRASKLTGYDTQTLMNMVYVASRFAISRRREKLSWSHHAELAALEPEEQERLLEIAERERLSVRCLRNENRRKRVTAASAGRTDSVGRQEDHAAVCPECGHRFDLATSKAAVASGRLVD